MLACTMCVRDLAQLRDLNQVSYAGVSTLKVSQGQSILNADAKLDGAYIKVIAQSRDVLNL